MHFFKSLMSLWNNVARFQDGSLRLQKVGKFDTREALDAAAKLRVDAAGRSIGCVRRIRTRFATTRDNDAGLARALEQGDRASAQFSRGTIKIHLHRIFRTVGVANR